MDKIIYIEEKKEFIINGKVIKESNLSENTKQQYMKVCKKQKLINDINDISIISKIKNKNVGKILFG